MADKIGALIYRDWQNGINDSICNYVLPDNYLRLALNCYTDESYDNALGDIKGVPGYVVLGAQIVNDKSILGLYDFNYSTPRLIATINNAGDTASLTYYWTGSAWAEVGAVPVSWTPSIKMRFASFLEYVFAANGVDAISTWDGDTATSWGTTQATSAPIGNLITNFSDRVVISGDQSTALNSTRIYYSSFPAAATGAITWSATTQYVGIDTDKQETNTALEVSGGILLIFKRRKLFTWNGFQTESDPVIDIGTPSQECVQTIKGTTIFFGETYNSGAVFAYAGSYPQEVSRPVRKWINAITTSEYENFGSWKDEDNFYLSVGDVTYESVAYSNVVLKFCVSKGTWAVLTLASKPLVSAERIASDVKTVVFGDDDGTVHTWNSGTTFNGSVINSVLRTKELEFGSRLKKKTIQKIGVHSSTPQGASVRCRIDGSKWIPLGSLKRTYEIIDCNLEGNYFEFEVSCANSGEPFIFDGFEFMDQYIKSYEI